MNTVMSSTASDPNCIAGAYDDDSPQKVYVGGPCSDLTEDSEGNVQAGANLRWVEMETVYASLTNNDGQEAPFVMYDAVVHAEEKDTHYELGVGTNHHVSSADYAHAGFFLSTTSFISKAEFAFSKNTFVTGYDKDSASYDTVKDVCVAPCCASPGASGCNCANNACPTNADMPVQPGDFKYSILAAAYDIGGTLKQSGEAVCEGHGYDQVTCLAQGCCQWDASTGASGECWSNVGNHQCPGGSTSTYAGGTAGNGWEAIKENFGVGSSGAKQLEGSLNVFQVADFSNMKSDRLTIKAPDGSSVTYANMNALDHSDPESSIYKVASLEIEADGFAADYTFPAHYNRGEWTSPAEGIQTRPSETKLVDIYAVKPSANDLKEMGVVNKPSEAANKKVIFLMYKFDATGIEATATGGKFLVYDPKVRNVAARNAANDASNNNDEKKKEDDTSSASGTSAAITLAAGLFATAIVAM